MSRRILDMSPTKLNHNDQKCLTKRVYCCIIEFETSFKVILSHSRIDLKNFDNVSTTDCKQRRLSAEANQTVISINSINNRFYVADRHTLTVAISSLHWHRSSYTQVQVQVRNKFHAFSSSVLSSTSLTTIIRNVLIKCLIFWFDIYGSVVYCRLKFQYTYHLDLFLSSVSVCTVYLNLQCPALLLVFLSCTYTYLCWWHGLAVTRWSRSTKLLYAGPG